MQRKAVPLPRQYVVMKSCEFQSNMFRFDFKRIIMAKNTEEAIEKSGNFHCIRFLLKSVTSKSEIQGDSEVVGGVGYLRLLLRFWLVLRI
jgi:hypothetical protein